MDAYFVSEFNHLAWWSLASNIPSCSLSYKFLDFVSVEDAIAITKGQILQLSMVNWVHTHQNAGLRYLKDFGFINCRRLCMLKEWRPKERRPKGRMSKECTLNERTPEAQCGPRLYIIKGPIRTAGAQAGFQEACSYL